jgi:hypothetical protein
MRQRSTPHARARRSLFAAVLAATLLAACGPGTSTTPSISVELGTASLDVVLGGSATVQVTLTRTGTAADVTLDAGGLPAWATATFSPPVLAGDALISTLTLGTDGTDPGVAPATFTLTVTATGDGVTASDELTVSVDLLSVYGKVLDVFGGAVMDAGVAVNGGPLVPVDADGGFLGPDVAVPYDLVVVELPVLPLATAPKATTVSGDLSEPVGAGQFGYVCLEGLEGPVTGCGAVPEGMTTFSFPASWVGADAVPARVRAWVLGVEGGAVTEYVRTGYVDVELENAVVANANVTLGAAPGAKEVEVWVTPPPGAIAASLTVFLRQSEHAVTPFPGMVSPYEIATFLLPDLPGASLVALATAAGPYGTQYTWNTAEYASGLVALNMPQLPSPIAPANGATGVDAATEFRATNPSGSPVTFAFSGDWIVYVTKSEPRTTLPDLTAYGVPAFSGDTYSWGLLVSHHAADVDQVAREGVLTSVIYSSMMMSGGPPPTAPSGSVSMSLSRTFTAD